MHKNLKPFSFMLAAIMLLLTACKANITRNQDGTLTLETTITQQELQEVITDSISDPLIKNIVVSLQPGYIIVSGERQRLNDAGKTDILTFRLDLRAGSGQLVASVSNAQIDGKPIEQNRVDNWNQTIANRLSKLGRKNPNSTLQSVSITTDAVTLTWNASR